MKNGFFSHLALTGIKKNKKLYFPYIVTCIGMVMMSYIISALSYSPLLNDMSGGSNVKLALTLGSWVIIIFSLIFLFYTNSFLIRRRNKEFGLYNVLGMDKKSIGKIIINESLIISSISLVAGIIIGIALSKLAELGLLNIIRTDITFGFNISLQAVLQTFICFCVIFAVIYVRARVLLRKNNPLELLQSEKTGEKAPKGNIIFAAAGLILLAIAYYMAVTITSPLSAMTLFFVAVVLVIIATYLLMISGSVTFCRMLQKCKKYYYTRKHFVSVASMVYRMKRNGAGLASICILCTMVLVMVSSTTSLYIGAEDCLHTRYTEDISTELHFDGIQKLSNETISTVKSIVNNAAKKNGVEQKEICNYSYANFYCIMENNKLRYEVTAIDSSSLSVYDKLTGIYIISLDDYNQMTGKHETLKKDEVFIHCSRVKYTQITINIADKMVYKIKGNVDDVEENGNALSTITPTIYVIVANLKDAVAPLNDEVDYNGDRILNISYYYGFNTDAEPSLHEAVTTDISKEINKLSAEDKCYSSYCTSLEENRADFYMTYGGLFFLGIVLSIVFIFAAILIIYYKQISEGYEDESRFEIMQKVGMTKKDIRKSINSQILTVFYIPLIFAGVHLAFAFPLIWKCLQLFNLFNLNLVIIVTVAAFLIFAVIYAAVYRITSNSYYSIVSGSANTYHKD